jgi:hypothetical protein
MIHSINMDLSRCSSSKSPGTSSTIFRSSTMTRRNLSVCRILWTLPSLRRGPGLVIRFHQDCKSENDTEIATTKTLQHPSERIATKSAGKRWLKASKPRLGKETCSTQRCSCNIQGKCWKRSMTKSDGTWLKASKPRKRRRAFGKGLMTWLWKSFCRRRLNTQWWELNIRRYGYESCYNFYDRKGIKSNAGERKKNWIWSTAWWYMLLLHYSEP